MDRTTNCYVYDQQPICISIPTTYDLTRLMILMYWQRSLTYIIERFALKRPIQIY